MWPKSKPEAILRIANFFSETQPSQQSPPSYRPTLASHLSPRFINVASLFFGVLTRVLPNSPGPASRPIRMQCRWLEYIAEVMQILGVPGPPSGEILVERVKTLRWAERHGDYEQVFLSNNNR